MMEFDRSGHYLRIDGDNYRQVFVVGDLHGCYDSLQEVLGKARFNPNTDLLISVGDLIDRGDKSLECLELMEQPWFRAVRGNHEEFAADAPGNPDAEAHWYRNGGHWFWDLNVRDRARATRLIDKVYDLPVVIEVNIAGRKSVIVHADYPDDDYVFGKDIDLNAAVWNRQRYMRLRNGTDNGILGADDFYFGHTPDNRIIESGNIHYIDTGCVLGGHLTLIRLK